MKNLFKCSYSDILPIKEALKKVNPRNNNIHSDEQIKILAKIINFQGQRSPIVISKRSGLIQKGHARLYAMDYLKWDSVAVDYQDYKTENEEYADMTADNEIARLSQLDINKFLEDIKEIDLGDFQLLGLKELPEFKFEEIDINLNKKSEELQNYNTSISSPVENLQDEWKSMPEFKQDDKESYRHVIVHFSTEKDAKEFFEMIGQKDTGKTKTVWIPPQERMDTEAKRYE